MIDTFILCIPTPLTVLHYANLYFCLFFKSTPLAVEKTYLCLPIIIYATIPIYLCIMLVLPVTYYTFTWNFAVRKIVSVIGLVACKNGIKMNENGARQESQRSQKTVRTP